MISGKQHWKLCFLLGVAIVSFWVATAWIPRNVPTNPHSLSFLASRAQTSAETAAITSTTALFVDRREFLGQIAATGAAALNTKNDGAYDTRGLGPPPLPKTTENSNRTRTGSGGGGRRNYLKRGGGDKEKYRSLNDNEEERIARRKTRLSLDEEEDRIGRRRTSSSSRPGGDRSSMKSSSKGSMSGRGGSSSSSNCFPADAWVQVYDEFEELWRPTKMEDLVLGDRVQTGIGQVSTIYAFGTRDPDTWIILEKLVLDETGDDFLEVTENHIVLEANGTSEVAWDIGPGYNLIRVPHSSNSNQTNRIVRKESIKKQGAYHPYTLDGKLVVNGFQVSVHSIDTVTPYLRLGRFLDYDIHEFQQLLFCPLRLLYGWSPETYSTMGGNHDALDGSHHYVDLIESLQIFLLPTTNENDEVNFASWSLPMLGLRILVVLFLLGFQIVEQILLPGNWNHWVATCLGVGLLTILMQRKSTRKKCRD